jgi:predicted RNase H-related nuclease YkuK (DUF458 family)
MCLLDWMEWIFTGNTCIDKNQFIGVIVIIYRFSKRALRLFSFTKIKNKCSLNAKLLRPLSRENNFFYLVFQLN